MRFMIRTLKGKVTKRDGESIILDVNNVGYLIFVLPTSSWKKDEDVLVYTHQHVREDALKLYGFASEEELDFFSKLINVNGVGPSHAISIMAASEITRIKNAIATGDIAILTMAKGIGKKVAQKIILELKGDIAETELSSDDQEVVSGLKALGFSPVEINKVMPELKGESLEEKLKSALAVLNKD